MLTHVWFTQTKLSPQGVPSLTRPCSGYSLLKFADPTVALLIVFLNRENVNNKLKIMFVFRVEGGGRHFIIIIHELYDDNVEHF